MANQNMEKWGRSKAKEMTKGYAKGGRVKGTTVNIILPQGETPTPPLAPPMPPKLPMGPPGAGPLPPPPGPGGPMGMKSGGKVKAGSESGEGRLDKIRSYGKKARSG